MDDADRENWWPQMAIYLSETHYGPEHYTDEVSPATLLSKLLGLRDQLRAAPDAEVDDFQIEVTKDEEGCFDVGYTNLNYVAPPEGLKPWGGENPPEGHYNCNDNKYTKYFSFAFEEFGKHREYTIVDETGAPLHIVLAEILIETSVYGWTPEHRLAFKEDLEARLDDYENKDVKTYSWEEVKEKLWPQDSSDTTNPATSAGS